uniref:Uncharacterized protein n=1 Tax=Tanacetum cinerariifolium TaxID=118510 RepID=A0A6L2M2C1_TANCI|nr:hypothetical protein [Tanacetum cinerariifolium]
MSLDHPFVHLFWPSRKRHRSPTTLVPITSLVPGALSLVCADLLSPRKRIKDSDFVTDFEVSLEENYEPYVARGSDLGVDVEESYEPYTEPDIDSNVQVDIDTCIAPADAIVVREMDVRVETRIEMEDEAEEEAESSVRGTIKIGVDRVIQLVVLDDIVDHVREDFLDLVSIDGSLEVLQRGLDVVMHELYDHMVEILVPRVRVIESFQRDHGHRIMATS